MSELDDEIKLSQETLMAPLILAKNLEEAYNVALKISSTKGVETFINKNATATKQLRDETAKLTKDTASLVDVQKVLATTIQKDAEAYKKEGDAVKKLNDTTKERIKQSDTQVKTMKTMRAELDANRAALATYKTEQERATKEVKGLVQMIQKQDAELEKLRQELGKNNKENDKAVSGLTKLKQQYKELQSQMLSVGEEFGVESEQFAKVAKEAGDIKDQIGDLAEATSAVSGEPIERLGGSFGMLQGKLGALDFKGATGAVKGMVGATKDLNFKTAIQGAGGFGKAVGALGKALLTNPIFLLIAVVVGIGMAIFALRDKVKIITAAFDLMGEAIDWIVQSAKDLADAVGLTTFAIDDATVKIVDDLEKQRAKWEQLYDDQIKLAGAAGKETEQLEKAKQNAIAATTKFAINRLEYQKKYGTKLSEDQQKQLTELLKANHDAEVELQAIDLRIAKNKEDAAKETAKKAREARLREEGDAVKLQKFLLQNEIEAQQKIITNDQATFDARMDAADKLIAKRKELAMVELDEGFNDPDATASGKKQAEAKFQQDMTDITAEGEANRVMVIKSNQDQELKNTQEFVDAKRAEAEKNLQNDINTINAELDAYKKMLIEKGISREEADKLLADKQKAMVEEMINAEIDAQRKILMIEQLTAEERAAVEQKLFDLKMKLTDLYYDNIGAKEKSGLEKGKEFIDKWIGTYTEFSQSVGDLFAAITAGRLQKLDEESDALEVQKNESLESSKDEQDKALKRAGDNAKLQQEIKEAYAIKDASLKEQYAKREEVLEKKRRQEVRKQAMLDKAIALSIGAIKLAQAIMAMLTVGPAGFALAAAAAAIGAIQLATIAAQPIPAAEKGIRGHKGGLIVAGEKDHELVEMPGGRLAVTDNKPTLYDLPAGTNIYSHNDPKTVNALAGRRLPLLVGRGPVPDRHMHGLLTDINRTIKRKPSVVVKGVIIGSTVHDTYIKRCMNG